MGTSGILTTHLKVLLKRYVFSSRLNNSRLYRIRVRSDEFATNKKMVACRNCVKEVSGLFYKYTHGQTGDT